jgi:hypothetical protein
MKPVTCLILSIFIFTSLACNITVPVERMQTGDTQTLQINEPAPQDNISTRLTISMGAGKLQINSGATGLIEGSIGFNVADWKPSITRLPHDISLTQGTNFSNRLPPQNVINDWQLRLGQYPLDLTINAGAYDSNLDLSGIPITNLAINDGASNVRVAFNSLNPASMQNLTYKTGASTVQLIGLGNANFSVMTFEGGAGSYTLDFSGNLQRAAHVQINSGVSDLKLIIPSGAACQVILTGAMNSVNTQGAWQIDGKTYSLPGQGPQLTISVELGVGSLSLITQ